MACIRKRRGQYVVDSRDASGRRQWKGFPTRQEAETYLAAILKTQGERPRGERPAIDSRVTLRTYVEDTWLPRIKDRQKPRTLDAYSRVMRQHILPALGTEPIAKLSRSKIKAAVDQWKTGATSRLGKTSRSHVALMVSVLRVALAEAVHDELRTTNPADGLRQHMGLAKATDAPEAIKVKAFTRPELALVLTTAPSRCPRLARAYEILAKTGLRIGELQALQWPDIEGAVLAVNRTMGPVVDGKPTTGSPKGGRSRQVDLSPGARAILAAQHTHRAAASLAAGQPLSPWVFANADGTPLDERTLQWNLKRVLAAAGLPSHHTPHSLRHSYASILLSAGVSPEYVRRQLGHKSLDLTIRVYGSWLPMHDPGAVAILDRLTDEPVATAVAFGAGRREIPGIQSRPVAVAPLQVYSQIPSKNPR